MPEETPDYARPVRRLALRWRKRNRQTGHDLLISTLAPAEVLKLLGRPAREAYETELVALAYAQLYDQRVGAIEVEIRESNADADARRDAPPPHVKCGRGHRHNSDVQVTECDERLARRAQHKTDMAARREIEAAR